MTDYVTIARITKTRGVRGEVTASLLTDFPERFAQIRRVRVLRQGVESQEVVQGYRFHRDRVILKFEGRDRPHEVEELVGGRVQIPEGQRVPLPDDSFYESDLIGCRVFSGKKELGCVARLFATGPEGHNLVVASALGEEFMVPLARQFVDRVDLLERRIDVQLPPGLREATRIGKKTSQSK